MNEANELRIQNEALMEENARSREFIEKLLRHPAFHPFLDDLSRDPAIAEAASQNLASSNSNADQSPSRSSKPVPQINDGISHEGPSRSSSEIKVPLRGNPWPVPDMDIGNFESPRIFAVLDLPHIERPLPEEHSLFDKDGILSFHTEFEPEKNVLDVMNTPAMDLSEKSGSIIANDAKGPGFDLYDDEASASSNPGHFSQSVSYVSKFTVEVITPHNSQFFNNHINDPSFDRIRRICTRMDPVYARIQSMTTHLEF